MTDQTTNRPPKRYDYIFGLHSGHLDDALTAPICKIAGVKHVNYIEPNGHLSGWWVYSLREDEASDWAPWIAHKVMMEIELLGGMDKLKVSPR